jgi:hypothetical protein
MTNGKVIAGIGGVMVGVGAIVAAMALPIIGLPLGALGLVVMGCGLAKTSPSVPNQGTNVETFAKFQLKPNEVQARWEQFLGPKPYSHKHPRTGQIDPHRLVSADGKRSIRYGDHERTSGPTKHHYHEETWTLDQQNQHDERRQSSCTGGLWVGKRTRIWRK